MLQPNTPYQVTKTSNVLKPGLLIHLLMHFFPKQAVYFTYYFIDQKAKLMQNMQVTKKICRLKKMQVTFSIWPTDANLSLTRNQLNNKLNEQI